MANFEKFANYQVSDAARNSVGMPRSKFYMPHTLKTTFNVGDLVPLGAPIEILPGDSIDDARTKCLARLSTAKFPTMDNAFVDFYAFFTPWRLLFDKTKEFFGENNENAWLTPTPLCSLTPRLVRSTKISSLGTPLIIPCGITLVCLAASLFLLVSLMVLPLT